MAFTDSKEVEKKRLEIVTYIGNYITEHKLKTGDKIPSENSLSQMFQTNRNTVRSALISLKIRGVLFSHKGKGFFVAERPSKFIMTQSPSLGLSEAMDNANLAYRNSLLDIIKRKPTISEQRRLELSEHEEVYFLAQLRYVNEVSFALCYSVIPEKFVPGLEEYTDRIKADFKGTNDIFMNMYGLKHPICSNTTIGSFPPTAKDIKYLKIPDSIPILQQENLYLSEDGIPIEYFVIRGRSDLFKISFNLNI